MYKVSFASFCAVVLMAHQAQSAFVIDDFNTGTLSILDNTANGTPVTDESNDASRLDTMSGTVGGTRFGLVNKSSGSGAVRIDVPDPNTAPPVIAGGHLEFNSEGNFQLTYDGNFDEAASDLGGFAGADRNFYLGGANAYIHVRAASATGITLSLVAYFGNSTIGVAAPIVIGDTDGVFANYFVLLSAFGDPSQFSDVRRFDVVGATQTPMSQDLSIDIIQVISEPEYQTLVPEPSSIALACMGLMGFGGYARRRMKARA